MRKIFKSFLTYSLLPDPQKTCRGCNCKFPHSGAKLNLNALRWRVYWSIVYRTGEADSIASCSAAPQKSLSSLFGRFTFTALRITFVSNEPVVCEPFCRFQVFIHTLMSASGISRCRLIRLWVASVFLGLFLQPDDFVCSFISFKVFSGLFA